MLLHRVVIENFRSIKSAEVMFDDSCCILVGINESGKSNIIKALEYLNPDKDVVEADIREPLPEEGEIKQSFVRFIFRLETEDKKRLIELLAVKFLGLDIQVDKIFYNKHTKKRLSLTEFVEENAGKVHTVYLIGNKRTGGSWSISSDYEFSPSVLCAVAGSVKVMSRDTGSELVVPKGGFVIATGLSSSTVEGLSRAEFSNFTGYYYLETQKYVNSVLPEVISWRYDDKYMLPERVSINDFIQDEDICVPLKNLFLIGGSESPSAELNNKIKKPDNVLYNYLNHISLSATAYFKKIWPEYGITFTLRENSGYLIPEVQDSHNRYKFEQRSDGFKRFVAILLMISVRRSIDDLGGAVILMDEPDVSLHPSGVRYLRDELLRVSRSNIVVISSHSIFMIDQDCISRHVIVTKNKEITDLEIANQSNFCDEEVLYKALGFSVFSVLNKYNIIFEGWRDKYLFKISMSKIPSKYRKKMSILKSVGYCHSNGVKGFSQIASMLDLANRSFIFVSDSDKPARENKAKYEEARYPGKWYTYAELSSTAITSEDFIDSKFLVKCLNSTFDEINFKGFSFPQNGKVEHLFLFLKKSGYKNDEAKALIDKFKSAVFDSLSPVSIHESYYDMLTEVAKVVHLE